MLKIGSKVFDGIFSEKNRKIIESFTIWSATIGFIFHLSLVLLNNYSIINIGNESLLLTNPISAIYTPFSIILYYEIFLLIYFLPRSFTTSILKQFEIISLIIIRRIFYDIPKLDSSKNNESRRFMWLIDALYDRKCFLLANAKEEIKNIYVGNQWKFEFERTSSRLLEMTRIAERH